MIDEKQKKKLLVNLRKLPIVQVACAKSGISRATFYRWKKESKTFSKEIEKSMQEGIDFVNDLSENQLIKLIRNENFSAIRFWLQNRHKAYANKVEVLERGMSDNQELTDEQKKIVEEALRLASACPKPNEQQNLRPNNSGDAEKSKSEN